MKKLVTKLTALLLVTGIGLSAISCDSSTNTTGGNEPGGQTDGSGTNGKTEFVIGNPQPLSGVNAQVGNAANKAAELAVEVINAAGGFNGVPVRLINYDDQGIPEEAVKIARKMVEDDKVDAVLGSLTSTNMLAAGKTYNDAKLVTFGTGNSPTWMEQGWEYVFRACLNTKLSMPAVADKMVEMDLKKIAVFQGLDDAAKTSAETFIAVAEERGIEILTTESYSEGDTDYSGQISKILATNPDAVFCSTNGPTMAIFAKQLRQLGYKGLAFNREGMTGDVIDVAGDGANYWVFAYPYVTYKSVDEATDPLMKDFLTKFEEKYNEMPYHDCAYRSWDAMMVMWEASKIAGSNDSDKLKEAISQIKDFDTLAGVQDFTDGTREGLHSLNFYVILDGKFQNFETWVEEGGYETFKAQQ